LNLIEGAKKRKTAQNAPVEVDAEIDGLVAARTAAKAAKNWAEADRIRDQLKDMGIELMDSKDGVTWKKI
ncbi:MAG: cysteine--tRNA ligase, partial [Oscillospiraceae bacterium]